MPLNKADMVMYVYTAGAVVSGVLLERSIGGDPVFMLAVSLVAGLIWVAYFNLQLRTRVQRFRDEARASR